MNPHHNTTSPASIDAQKRASTHAQIENARAVIDAHEQDEPERPDRGEPTDAAWEREEAALRSARPIVDANRTARELVYLLEENRPVDAAAKLAGLPASQALSVALALDCPRHHRAALRLAYDANERETLESEQAHDKACRAICANVSDRLSTTDETLESIMDGLRDQLSEIGYAVDHPEDFDAEPPTA